MALTGNELGPFGELLVAALEPWMNEDLEIVCAAIAAMGFNTILELVGEEGAENTPGWQPPWGKLLDPDAEPFPADPAKESERLAYLGQYVGVAVPRGTPPAEARALVKAKAGTERGTQASIESAIQLNLTEGASFEIFTRRNLADEPDPYGFVVVVNGKNLIKRWFATTGKWEAQTGTWQNASAHEGDLREAILRVKPAGLVFWIILTEDHPWLAVKGSWAAQTTLWEHT